MKNKIFFLFIAWMFTGSFLLFSDTALAVTAKPDPIVYTQPDGTKLTILLKGDEFIHWAETSDGYTIMTNREGYYEYATLDKSGRLTFSGVHASDPSRRSQAELSWLRNNTKGLFFSRDQVAEMRARLRNPGETDAPLSGGFPTTGTRKLLMILANFNNTTTTYTQANFNNYMNQVNYNSTGSFRDYYLEVSYGQLTVNTTVTVWVTLPNTHDYYGPESKWGEFAYQSVVAANNQAAINFAEYDNNLDGTVDGVAIIHQGRGQEESGSTLDIWSHSWELSSAGYSYAQRTFDGVQVESYTAQPERSASGMGTIGVMCHEFGHNLGSPDFYDTDYSTNGSYSGTGRWDLMAGGSWNGSSGTKPAHPNAWIKAYFNWTTPVVLSTVQTKTLRNAQVYTDVVRYNTTTANEYFLCENRQQTGFDVGIPGHGLIIYHVDGNYITLHSNANDINAGSHQGLYPVCANATGNPPTTYGTINGTGCPFPGTAGKTSFTDATTPHSHSWAGANTNYPLTNITENTTTKEITFCFLSCNAIIDPTNFSAVPFSASQINLGWTLNAATNPVMVAYSTASAFGTPFTGTSYSAGNTIPGGGTVLYNGTNTTFNHTGLNPTTTYYYKAWSVATGANYSFGVTVNATTPCAVYYPVSVSISASANPVCTGTAVTFTATPVNGGSAPTYQWKVNGFAMQGATNPTYTFTPAHGNAVQCVLTSNAACTTGNPATSNTITMTVNPNLIAGSISANQSICSNTLPSILNGVAPANGTNPVYQWQSSLDNNTFTNINGATLLNYQPRELTNTTYYRQVQNASGTCGGPLPTNTLTITVNPLKPVSVSIAVSNNPVCEGTSVTFTATPVNGGSAPSYQWKVNATNVTNATNASFTYVPADGDVVTCELTSNELCPTGNPATSNSITITVVPLKQASVSIAESANPICAGTAVVFTATTENGGSTPTYQWKVNGNNVGPNAVVYQYVPANGDVISCVFTSSEICATGNPANSNAITMSTLPQLIVGSVTADQTICENALPLQLTGTAPLNGTNPVYQWQSSLDNNTFNNINGATMLSYQPGALAATTYFRQMQNATGTCGGPLPTNTLTITVNPLKPVSVSIIESANPVCAGTAVTFTATPVNGGSAPDYQWKVNGANTGTNSPVFSYIPLNGDAITCVLTSNEICPTGNPAVSNSVTMTVNPLKPVSVSIIESANPVCAGTVVTFNATPVNGGTVPFYQWKVNGTNAGTNSAAFTYTPLNGDVITCVLTSNEICPTGNPAVSNPVTMTVNPLKPVSVSITASANPVCDGTLVLFAATPVNGGTTPIFQWKVNGTNAGTNNTAFTYTPANGDVITCVLTSNEICPTGNPAVSSPVTMTVNPLKPVSVSIVESANPVCAGTVVTFTATPVNGGTAPFYQWKVNGSNAGTNNTAFTYTPANGDVITCVLTSNEICPTGNPATSSPITMTVNPLKPVSVSIVESANPVCAGTVVTFTATPVNGGSAPYYQWKVNGTNAGANSTAFNYTPLNGDVITCMLTSNEICPTGNPAVSNPVTMTVNPLKPVSVSIVESANPVCAGTVVTFNATPVNGGTAPFYQWKVNGTNAGTNNAIFTYTPMNGDVVTCVLTSNEICSTGNPAVSNPVTMTVNPLKPVSVSIIESANPVCAGTVVTFTATPVNGGSAPYYQWKVNSTNAGANSTAFTYTPLNGDVITCVLTSNEICPTGNPATSSPITMTVNPLKPVSVSIMASANPVCAGASVSFTATPVNGGTAPFYQWKVNGTNAGTNSTTFTHTPLNGDVITCVLTSNEICPTGNPAVSNPVTMTVNPLKPVSVSIIESANPVCAGTVVTFTATPVNGGTVPFYQWKVNGTNAGTNNAIFTYTPMNGDIVTCVLTSNEICPTGNPAVSSPVTMTVNPLKPVSVSITASANPVCAGTSVTFTAMPVNGGISPTYQWTVNGANRPGATNSTFTYTPVNGNLVRCVLTSSEPCTNNNPATSNAITMTLNPLLPVSITITASANPVLSGTLVTFTATPVNGGTTPFRQWFVNGKAVGSNTATYSYIPFNNDNVTCVLTSNAVCASGNPATSNSVVMSVITIPAINTLQNMNLTGIHCFDALQTILVAGSGTTFIVQNGARVTLIAGQKISLRAGTRVKSGGYLRGYIAPSGPFCSLTPSLPAVVAGQEENQPVQQGSFFKVYPNPTEGDFVLEFIGDRPVNSCHVEIYNMTGKRQLSRDLEGDRVFNFTLSDRPSGIYFIKVLSGENSGTVKIIKQN